MADSVTVGTGGTGSRFLRRDYPNQEGLRLGFDKLEGTQEFLVEEGL